MYLLIDGKHFVYRAFYATPELTRSTDSFPIGAIHGWSRIMWSLMDEYPTGTYEIFWDAGSKARLEMDSNYKANRKPVPEPMRPQLPYIEKLANLMGIASYKEEGHEADDLIGTRASDLAAKGEEVLIVSADKDFAQCVNEKIHMLMPPPTANTKDGWKRLTPEGVVEKFGVTPDQIADYLALMGDTSDNVKGLEGVGPKTAGEWLKAYKNLEGIFANCGKLNPKRFQNVVYESQEMLLKNRQMTTLHKRELPAAIRTEGQRDGAQVVAIFKELHLKTCGEEAQKRYGANV